MKTKNIVLSVGGLLLAGACLAWGGSHKCPCEGSAAAATPAVATPDHPEPKARGIEHTHMIAPAVLTLEQGATDASGATEYIAHIDVQDQINYPVVLDLFPGKDGKLLAGTAEETLDLSGAMNSRITRSFKVQGVASADNPVKAHMAGQSAGAVVGFYADRQYPPIPEMKVQRGNGPTPPGGRPPVAAPSLKNRGVGN